MKKPLTAVLIAGMPFVASCTDPQKETIKILGKQGLVVVLPARDYIKPGGLVVLPPTGAPFYFDPLDDVPPASPSDFKAIIPAQSLTQSAGLEAGLKAVTALLPISVQGKSNSTVTLGQIDTDGKRLESPKVDAVIGSPNTRAKVLAQLPPNTKNRVFIIQDVYSGKQLQLKSTSNKSLDVAYGAGGSKPPDCSTASSDKTDQKNTDQKNADSQSQKGQTSTKANSSTDTGNNASKNQTNKKPGDMAATQTPQTGAAAMSASLGVCYATDGSLSFTSTSLIPFAVRLNELEVKNGVLQVKVGDLHFTKSLGDPELEKRTSIIKSADPVIHDLVKSQ